MDNTKIAELPENIKKLIEDEAYKEEIYPRKYGSGTREGYSTMMLYEINSERSECFEKGAIFGYNLASANTGKGGVWVKVSERQPSSAIVDTYHVNVKYLDMDDSVLMPSACTYSGEWETNENVEVIEWLDETSSPISVGPKTEQGIEAVEFKNLLKAIEEWKYSDDHYLDNSKGFQIAAASQELNDKCKALKKAYNLYKSVIKL